MKKILLTILLPLIFIACTTQKKLAENQSASPVDDPIFGGDGTLLLGRAIELISCEERGSVTYSRSAAPAYLVNKLTHALREGEGVMLGSKSYTIVPLKKGYYSLMPEDSVLTYTLLVTVQTDSTLNQSQVENYFVMQKLCKRKI